MQDFAFTDIDAWGKDMFKKCSDNLDGTKFYNIKFENNGKKFHI